MVALWDLKEMPFFKMVVDVIATVLLIIMNNISELRGFFES